MTFSNSQITRGTNASIKFDFSKLDLHVSDITDCVMTVRVDNAVSEYTMEDLVFDTDADTIGYLFSQAETLQFDPGSLLTFELHPIINGLRYKSQKITVRVTDTDLNREMS